MGAIAFFCGGFKPTQQDNLTGVYWGAFDPPTAAHEAIIIAALEDISLKKLVVIINNHSYKDYTYTLEKRLELMHKIFQKNDLKNVELFWQDDNRKLNFLELKQIFQASICAIAGYDAYKKWTNYSTQQERLLYDAIAVVPRGDDIPFLFDNIAFLLPINPEYRYVSSTKVKDVLSCKIVDNVSSDSSERNISIK